MTRGAISMSSDSILDGEIKRRRKETWKKAGRFALWAIPALLLLISVAVWVRDNTAVPAVVFIALSCYWLGINTHTHFME